MANGYVLRDTGQFDKALVLNEQTLELRKAKSVGASLRSPV